MSLEVLDRHSEALFEFLWCPVCGQEVFTHIPFEEVFCKNSKTQVFDIHSRLKIFGPRVCLRNKLIESGAFQWFVSALPLNFLLWHRLLIRCLRSIRKILFAGPEFRKYQILKIATC